MDLREELPYRTEYAKSGRASCKSCKDTIEKASLRMAVMVRSPFFDGLQPNWHHFQCFFKRWRPKVEEIAHYAQLKYEDQKKIEEAIKQSSGLTSDQTNAPKAKSKKTSTKKKTDDADSADTKDVLQFSDFKVETAKSSRSKCRLCENTIAKNSIRISRLDRDSDDAKRFGPIDRWFHVECFVIARASLEFFGSAQELPFFGQLSASDQKDLKKRLPAIERPKESSADGSKASEGKDANESSESPPKKKKLNGSEEKALKKQSDLLFENQEFLQTMKKSHLEQLMEYNDIQVPKGMDSKLERLADAMTFGVLNKCPECKSGQLVFRISGYICTGNISEWAKCEFQTTAKPERKKFKVPEELAETYDFLKTYKFKPKERLYVPALKEAVPKPKPSTSTAKAESANGTALPSLNGYNIFCFGKLKSNKRSLKARLKKLGANMTERVDRTTLCIISTKAEFDKQSAQILEAKELSVPIVSEDFLDGVENDSNPIQAISLNRLDDFEVDVEKRFSNLNVKEKMKSAFKSGAKSGSGRNEKSGKQKMVLKGGSVVDPDCEYANVTHIYKEKNDVFNAILNKVELSRNQNSYYKLQLLEHDSKPNKYYVFRSWGRTGTDIGGNKTENFSSKAEAIDSFKDLYLERTQNEWDERNQFKKYPDSYFPVDVDYGGDTHLPKLESGKESSLPKPVQDLICMLFDVEKMKEQMLEFELDLDRMPLGKLSKKQLLNAYSVLKELSQLIEDKPPNSSKLKDATNRFYTLIPHNFGTDRPPLIDTEEMIKTKMDVLDALLDIEMAYEMITDSSDKELSPVDHHYQRLNTKIEPLSRDNEEFAIIEKYLKNTHGSTHHFSLDIVDAFRVERTGESERYKKFADFENRMLLWHGSRVTNFAGILSQGLRIAPPEAPVTGYMFGKGLYFADMVTKSAGYCHHSSNNNIGLLLLSEVAVGQPWELINAKDVKKLPKNKHSVKGVGSSEPDPNEIHVMPNGVKVPAGKGVAVKDKKCSLLYNEYIVYDVNQVNIKYLLKCKFDSKSLF